MRSCQQQTHTAMMTRDSGVRNVEISLNHSQGCDGVCVDDDGEEGTAMFEGKRLIM